MKKRARIGSRSSGRSARRIGSSTGSTSKRSAAAEPMLQEAPESAAAFRSRMAGYTWGRHTYAKVALETGRRLIWLSRRLGHSSLKVTSDVYGHFGAKERKAEAELMEGVFGV
jgi:site-specific recombinase XerD